MQLAVMMVQAKQARNNAGWGFPKPAASLVKPNAAATASLELQRNVRVSVWLASMGDAQV